MLVAKNMLKALEESENLDVKTEAKASANEEEDLGKVLKLIFGNKEASSHKGIRYSDGKERSSSFDD